MTMNDFATWVQAEMDKCNVHDEIETSKKIVEIMKKFHAIGREEEPKEANQELVKKPRRGGVFLFVLVRSPSQGWGHILQGLRQTCR